MNYGQRVEDKIEIIENILKKYPWIQIVPVMSKSNLEKEFKLNTQDDNEELIDQCYQEYCVAVKCYDYLRIRNSKNKLPEEIKQRCLKANIGGVFGYTEELENLYKSSSVYKGFLAYIFHKFDTFENFLKQYEEGLLNEEDAKMATLFIKPVYDTDLNEYSALYEILVKNIYDIPNNGTKKGLIIISSKNLDEEIDSILSDQEKEIIRYRYGLDDGKTKSLEYVGEKFGLSRERIRQIEINAFKKFRRNFKSQTYMNDLNDLISEINPSETKKQELLEADGILRLTPNDEKQKEAFKVIRNFIDEDVKEFESIKEESDPFIDMTIQEMFGAIKMTGMRTKLYRCLSIYSGAYTVKDLLEYDKTKLLKIRGLGENLLNELLAIFAKHGYTMDDEGNFVTEEEYIKNKDIEINEENVLTTNIKRFKMSGRLYRCLDGTGDIKVFKDILAHDYGYYKNIKNMGEATFNELVELVQKYGYEIPKELIKINKETVLDVPIERLNMSERLYNCLKRTGNIEVFKDILAHNYKYYQNLRKLGTKSLEELTNLVQKYGYELPKEETIVITKENVLDMPIKKLNISERLRTCLDSVGDIEVFGDIFAHDYEYYQNRKGMGRVTLKELVTLVHKYGYEIQNEINGKELYLNNKEDILNVSIYKIKMSERLRTCLKRRNIEVFGEILAFDYHYFENIRTLGRVTLKELTNLVHKYGYEIQGEPKLETEMNETIVDKIKEQNKDIQRSLEDKEEKSRMLDIYIKAMEKQEKKEKSRLLDEYIKEIEEQEKKEQEEKSRLLNEYIKAMEEQKKLKDMEASIDKEINDKLQLLKSYGLKNENKQ